jgi:hypothetical protein
VWDALVVAAAASVDCCCAIALVATIALVTSNAVFTQTFAPRKGSLQSCPYIVIASVLRSSKPFI